MSSRYVQIAAALIVAGLLFELLSLLALTPTTFVIFMALGIPLIAAGAIFYLYRLFRFFRAKGAL